MAEGENGRRRGEDAFDVDDILPELSEFDPDLDDLLDLSEAPEPLPAPPPPPTPPRVQPWRPTPPPRSRPEPPSKRVAPDEPPPHRPEPADHRLSERPSPPEHRPEHRRPSPPPGEAKPARDPSWDDDLEIPDFVRSEPESEPESEPAIGSEALREEPESEPEEREEPVEGRGPHRLRAGTGPEVDHLMPPEPEGPAFIDRVVERRHEVEEPSWESPRPEPAPEHLEVAPQDDVWVADESVVEAEADEMPPHEAEPVEPLASAEAIDEAEAREAPTAIEDLDDIEATEDVEDIEAAPVDPLAPDHEPAAVPPPEDAPPRMPGAPISEVDSFAAQLGDLLSTAEPEPGPVESGGPVGSLEPTETHEPLASPGPTPVPPAPETRPAPPRVATALATRTPTPAELAPRLPPLPTVALRRAPCAEEGQRVEAPAAGEPASYSWAARGAIVFLALAAAAAVVLTNPRSGDDDPEGGAAPAAAGVEEGAGDAPDARAPADAQAPATPVDPGVSLVAEADAPLVDVYPEPDAPRADTSLEHPTEVGGPLIFLVEEQRGEWLRVQLPVSDDGATGWVRAEQVTLSQHEYRVEVRLSEHLVEVFRGDESVFEYQVALGVDAPEAGSEFYIKELLKPPNPDTTYGEYAFGFSGFSNTLAKFTSGEDVVAIHGIDDPSVIGTDVATGCIGMTNEDIGELVGELPLGTPVDVLG